MSVLSYSFKQSRMEVKYTKKDLFRSTRYSAIIKRTFTKYQGLTKRRQFCTSLKSQDRWRLVADSRCLRTWNKYRNYLSQVRKLLVLSTDMLLVKSTDSAYSKYQCYLAPALGSFFFKSILNLRKCHYINGRDNSLELQIIFY